MLLPQAIMVLIALIHPNLAHSVLFLEIVDMHSLIPKYVSGATFNLPTLYRIFGDTPI